MNSIYNETGQQTQLKLHVQQEQPFEVKEFEQRAQNAMALVDDLVLKNYLTKISNYELMPLKDASTENIRLFKINKIAYDKDEYATDKFMSVVSAMSYADCSISLIIDGYDDRTDFYLGINGLDENRSASNIVRTFEDSLKGQFPGSIIDNEINIEKGSASEKDKLLKSLIQACAVSSCVGVPTIRTDKSEYSNKNYIQGIEKFVEAMRGKRYTAVVLADNLTNSLQQWRADYENIYSEMSSMATQQMAYSTNESLANAISRTKGVADAITKSSTIGSSVANTETRTVSNSESHTEGNSHTEGISSGENGGFSVILASWGDNESESSSDTHSTSITNSTSNSLATGITKTTNQSNTEGNTHTESFNETDGTTSTIGSSKNFTLTTQNKHVQEVLKRIDKQLERISQSEGSGMWSAATYFLSYGTDRATAETAATIFHSIMQGEQSGVEKSAINTWYAAQANEIIKHISLFMHPKFKYRTEDKTIPLAATSLLSSREVAMMIGLPRKSVVGLPVVEHISLAKDVVRLWRKNIGNNIRLGCIYDQGEPRANKVSLDTRSLTMHTFVTGSTGCGKSNTIYHLINQLRRQARFLIIEPAKGEYKNIFGDVNVYGTNPLVTNLLKINPFKFPQGIHVQEHIDRLVEIFNVCWPMYAAMPAVLKKSMLKAYEDCGWDMAMSTNKYSDNLFPTFVDVLEALSSVIKSSEYSADTKGDYIGSLQTRVESLANGINGMIFCGDELGDKRLFDEDVIVDLSRIGSQETKSLIMGILVMRLSEYRSVSGLVNSDLRHITVLEEAHNLLKRCSQEQSQEGSNVAGKAVEMISNSIAEMRTYGEGFVIVDQSPGAVDISTIRNTNTKIVMRLPENEDRKVAGKSCALKDEQIDEIAKLPTGVAVVYQNDWEEPVLCQINKFDDSQAHTFVFDKKEGETTHQYEIPNELIKFMLSGRTIVGLDFDLEMVKKQIWQSQLSNSKKIMLHQAASAYETSKYVKIWDNDMFPELSSILTSLLDINKEIGEALEKSEDFDDLDRRLCDLIHERTDLPFEVDDTVEQCILRDMSLKGESEMTIYNGWLTNKGF